MNPRKWLTLAFIEIDVRPRSQRVQTLEVEIMIQYA